MKQIFLLGKQLVCNGLIFFYENSTPTLINLITTLINLRRNKVKLMDR